MTFTEIYARSNNVCRWYEMWANVAVGQDSAPTPTTLNLQPFEQWIEDWQVKLAELQARRIQ